MKTTQKISREFYSLSITSIIILALLATFLFQPFIAVSVNVLILFMALGILYGGSLMWMAYNAHHSKKGKVFLGIFFALLFFAAAVYQSSNFPAQNGSYLLATSGIGALAGINIASSYWRSHE